MLILGAGIGGISAATELAKLLGETHSVTLIDRKERFYECAYNLGIVSGDVTDPVAGEGDLSAIACNGIEFVRACAGWTPVRCVPCQQWIRSSPLLKTQTEW